MKSVPHTNRAKLGISAFTLVELVVVITILAILATVGFLALSGYTQDAKDSAIKANVRSLQTAITSEAAVTNNSPRYYIVHDTWAALSGAFAYVDGDPIALTGGDWNATGTNYSAGNPDYVKLKVNPEKFRISQTFPVRNFFDGADAAYESQQVSIWAIDVAARPGGGSRVRATSYFQVAAISPATKKAIVSGNFISSGTGASGLIKDPVQSSSSGALVDGSVSVWPTLVSGSCTGLPANGAFFGGATSYSLSSVAPGTSFMAEYAAIPDQNSCQFNCSAGIWNGASCVTTCPSGAVCSGMATEFATAGTFTFVPVVTGTYKLETYGSQGGNMGSYPGGLGGYAYGETTLTGGVTYYVYVGSVGTNGGVAGYGGGSPGGGGSDIRKISGTLSSRIIVGGGGGWAGGYSFWGGYGGGTTGGRWLWDDGGWGGTQTAGGAAGPYGSNPGTLWTWGTCNWWGENCGGGGGGYYGWAGGSGSGNNGWGGGGSWYVGWLSNSGMQSGVRSGNGLVRITKL